MTPQPRTRVALVFVEGEVNVWLRFGVPRAALTLDASRRIAEFAPGDLFCRVVWLANAYGTVRWSLEVLRAPQPAERITRLPGIAPGAHVLLRVATPAKTRRALALIDAIERQGIAAAEVSEDYWRAVHSRFAADVEPHLYTAAEHAAWRGRCALHA